MNTPETTPKAAPEAGLTDWRSIADDLASALERLDALYRSEQDANAPVTRPDWLRHPWQRYHLALADAATAGSAIEIELRKSFEIADGQLAAEKVAGNIVKEHYWRGELAALHRMRRAIQSPPTNPTANTSKA